MKGTDIRNGFVRTFVADPKMGRSIWKRIRKEFRRYQYGHQVIGLILGLMLLQTWLLFRRMEHPSQFEGILILALALDSFYLIAAALVRALAVSGGREVLMARTAESCSFTERALIIGNHCCLWTSSLRVRMSVVLQAPGRPISFPSILMTRIGKRTISRS